MMQACRKPWSEDELYRFWMLTHRRPAWLPFLCERLGLDAKEEEYLTDLDDEWLASGKDWEKHWRKGMGAMAIQFQREAVKSTPTKSGRLTEDQIRRARSRPLETVLVEPPTKWLIHCPVHLERTGRQDIHPSMLVRGGFGYCFSCGGSLDSIGYLMKLRGLSFRQAVEALQ